MIRKQQPLLLLGAGLVLIAMAVVVTFLVIGNNGGGNKTTDAGPLAGEKASTSTGGTTGGKEVIAPMPANKWSLLLEELPANYQVDVPNTFIQNISTYSSSYWFKSEQEGSKLANEWRIIDGFQALYQPRGLAADVAQGAAYIRIETYMFQTADGAKLAWAYYDNLLKTINESEAVKTKGLANDSSAYRIISGTVGPSEIVAVYHRFSFRRGNTIVSVQTWGGQPFLNIDTARDIAVTIDNKLLGVRPATEPTPIPTPSFPGLGN